MTKTNEEILNKLAFLQKTIPSFQRFQVCNFADDGENLRTLDIIYEHYVLNKEYNKKFMRECFKKSRDSLLKNLIAKKSAVITEKLLKMQEYKNSNSIFCFLSFGSEVITDSIISFSIISNKIVSAPKICNNTMISCKISENTIFLINRYGVREPKDPLSISKDNIDLVLVPGLAYNPLGYRIGYGGGFYDKFLADFKGASIGLVFREFLVEDIIPDKHDIPVDFLITD